MTSTGNLSRDHVICLILFASMCNLVIPSPLMPQLQIGQVIFNLLGCQLPEPRAPCPFYSLDPEKVVCGRSNDACNNMVGK